jgi:hypothetical protein
MRSRFLGVALTLSALVFGAAAPAAAQIIHGKLVAEGLNLPIDGATVQLLDARGNELNRVMQTNVKGTFAMRLDPGRYMLRIRRIGYNPLTTAVIELGENQVYEATYRVSPVAVRLATQRVTERPNLEWGRDGFDRRKALGTGGIFLTRAELSTKDQRDITWLFRDVPGIDVLPDGQVKSTEGWRCLYFKMNGIPVSFVPRALPGELGFPTLQELVPTGHDVMGIEVYREFREVPEEWRMDAWAPGESVLGTGTTNRAQERLPLGQRARDPKLETPCGLVAIWTRAAW